MGVTGIQQWYPHPLHLIDVIESQVVRLLCLKLLLCCHIKRDTTGEFPDPYNLVAEFTGNHDHVGKVVKRWSRWRRWRSWDGNAMTLYFPAGDMAWFVGEECVCLSVLEIFGRSRRTTCLTLCSGLAKRFDGNPIDYILCERTRIYLTIINWY